MNKLTLFITILFFYACNSNNKKKPEILKKETQTLIENSNKNEDPVAGIYTAIVDSNNADDCKLSIELVKSKGNYRFTLKTNSRNIKGKANFVTNKSGEKYVVLEDIPWDEYEGDISNEEDTMKTKAIEIPEGIDFLYNKDTLTIQNYGNAMNYYTKLGECGAKFIQLVKK
ncbi:hypothetical protein [Flavobacterium sp.]|uniref:hypothetical protein n=1 Tax=Flavobacterium sp. TaxID=239 RepID=UPI003263DB98